MCLRVGADILGRAASWPGAAASRKDSDFQRKCLSILLSFETSPNPACSSLLSWQHRELEGQGVVPPLTKAKAISKTFWDRRVVYGSFLEDKSLIQMSLGSGGTR